MSAGDVEEERDITGAGDAGTLTPTRSLSLSSPVFFLSGGAQARARGHLLPLHQLTGKLNIRRLRLTKSIFSKVAFQIRKLDKSVADDDSTNSIVEREVWQVSLLDQG